MNAPKVVKELSGFKLVKELGHGGMGKVFLARQTALDRHVALKILVPDLASDIEFVERFHREAKAAALFQHPNVVSVFDQGQDSDSGVHYIAFEYVDGGSLDELVTREGRLPEARALPIIRDIALALDFAESREIVHRDVKPENILLTKAGAPKLADLGLAKRTGAANTVTQTGVVLGTPLYMAPEQALGEDLDIRADIYALGLVLWYALTGLTPFDEDHTQSSLQILAKHINQDLPDVRDRAPEVSEHTAKVIKWMTARDRRLRYGAAEQVALDLDAALAGRAPLGPRDQGSDTTVLFGAEHRRPPSARAARAPSGRAPRPSGRAPAQAGTAPERLPSPTLPIVGGVLIAALGVGIGLALALTTGKSEQPAAVAVTPDPPPAPAPTVPSAPTGPREATTSPPPRPIEPAPTVTTEAATRASPARPVAATDLPPPATEPAPPEVDVPEPEPPTEPAPAPARTAEDELLARLDAGMKRLGECYKRDVARAPAVWQELAQVTERLRPALDSPTVQAVERLGQLVGAWEAVLRSGPAERDAAEEALEALLAEAERAPIPCRAGKLVDASVDVWRATLADVDQVEAMLGVADRKGREVLRVGVRGAELRWGALFLSHRLVLVDEWPDARTPRLGRDTPRDPPSRQGAFGVLTGDTLQDIEAVIGLLPEHGAPTALARVDLAHDDGAPRSTFLAGRVVDVPVSSTGTPLGHARGLLVVPARRVGADFDLEVVLAGRKVEVRRSKVSVDDGKPLDAPDWAEHPAIVVEVRAQPRLLSLDATTGAVLGQVELPIRLEPVDGAVEVKYGTRVALARVALLQPQGADAPAPRRGRRGR